MNTKDRDAFLALADKLGYEVSNFADAPQGPGMGQLVKKAEAGTIEEIETTTLVLVKRTTYAKAQG
jgi:hypothetical protein